MNNTVPNSCPRGVDEGRIIDLTIEPESAAIPSTGVRNQGVPAKVEPEDAPGDIQEVSHSDNEEPGGKNAPRYSRRTQKSPSHYITRLNADGEQSYDGDLNLSYRGQRYILREGVVGVNLGSAQGECDKDTPPTQLVNRVIHLDLQDLEPEMRFVMGDWEVDEHIIGLVMAQQFYLKKRG